MPEIKTQEDLTTTNLKEIDLHIAEYNALTTRCTYFANINNIILTALVAWILVMVSIWNKDYEYLLTWVLLLGAQIIAYINAVYFHSNYNIIRYIESDLKPKICQLLNTESFWCYEIYLLKQRKTIKGTSIFEYSGIVIAIISIIICVIYRFYLWVSWDWLGLSLNFLALILLIIKTHQGVKIRLSGWK